MRLAVLASGSGTLLEAILEAGLPVWTFEVDGHVIELHRALQRSGHRVGERAGAALHTVRTAGARLVAVLPAAPGAVVAQDVPGTF